MKKNRKNVGGVRKPTTKTTTRKSSPAARRPTKAAMTRKSKDIWSNQAQVGFVIDIYKDDLDDHHHRHGIKPGKYVVEDINQVSVGRNKGYRVTARKLSPSNRYNPRGHSIQFNQQVRSDSTIDRVRVVGHMARTFSPMKRINAAKIKQMGG
jgi:hypothetical protein